jgi:hypothetical protein
MLISLAVLFLVVMAVFLYETIEVVVTQAARVSATPAQQNNSGFDLKDAARIDFKGALGNNSTTVQ